VSLDSYVRNGGTYIGSERGGQHEAAAPMGIAEVDAITDQISAVDTKRGQLVGRYFADMRSILGQIGRILRPGGHAVIVVCPSNIRRIPIAWHRAFSTLGAQLPQGQRLAEVEVIERRIDDYRRLLPYMNAGEQLGRRMRTEYVLVLQKAALTGNTGGTDAHIA